jgi:hypothetical protein
MKSLLKKIVFISLFAILLFSCSKNDPSVIPAGEEKVLVINQGNYTEHSASLSLYDEESQEISNRVYETANGVSIGATIISGLITPSGEAALVCNYPDKIIFIDPATAVDKNKTITDGLASPRNMIVTSTYTYVTNWDYTYNVNEYGVWEFVDSYVAIYDNATMTLQNKVLAGTDAEGILILGNRLFVAVKEGVAVFSITGNTIQKVTVLKPTGVTAGARYMVLDASLRLWASFPGEGVAEIDPVSMAVLSFTEVPVDSMDGFITTDPDGLNILTYNTVFDSQYMPVSASVYKVNASTKVVTQLFTGTYFYGVGVSPFTGDMFTAEVSFTSNSVMKVVSPDGTLRKSATAGIGTSRYLFF